MSLRRAIPFWARKKKTTADPFAGAYGAWSFRRINPLYSGPLCRVEKTGGIQVDMGSGKSSLSVSDFQTEAAGGILKLIKFYDQYSVNDLTFTASKADICNNSGVCYTYLGKPTTWNLEDYIFGASDKAIRLESGSNISTCLIYVYRRIATPSFGCLIGSSSSGSYGIFAQNGSSADPLTGAYTNNSYATFSWLRNGSQIVSPTRGQAYNEYGNGGVYIESNVGYNSAVPTPYINGIAYGPILGYFSELIIMRGNSTSFNLTTAGNFSSAVNSFYSAY